MVQSFIKVISPQASVKDRAGVFLHRISSGIRLLLTFINKIYVVAHWAFIIGVFLILHFTEPAANERHGHPTGQNTLL